VNGGRVRAHTATAGPPTPSGAGPVSGTTRSARVGRRRALEQRSRALVPAAVAGVLGALPVLLVLGAVPGRRPTVLIEWMFRGFTACALDGGALNPVIMTCERAGVPLGMHQLDGGLTYPLGGLLVRAGVDPLGAWQVAVALPLIAGFAALFWLGRRLTGSVGLAAGMVAVVALNGTLTSRTWNWYWNTVAIVLLPLLFAALHVLFVRAALVREGLRRAGILVAPGLACVASAIVIGIEWQYAAMFAAAITSAAIVVLVAPRGWERGTRLLLLTVGAAGLGLVATLLRWRMTLAGITSQTDNFLTNATNEGVDLVALVAPDGRASLLGAALDGLGLDGLLAERLSDGRMLWVAPYLGVGLLVLLAAVLLGGRDSTEGTGPPGVADDRRRTAGSRAPGGIQVGRREYLLLLAVVAAGSLLVSLGPEWHVASVALPDAHVTSPLRWLWTATPVRWIRYPWTFNAVTFVALVLGIGALLPSLPRRPPGRSPLVWAVGALVVLELVSPQVLTSMVDPAPSVPNAPSQLTTADPAIVAFEDEELSELRWEMAAAGGPVTLLPWSNTWVIPYLGPASGIEMRNAGIDRNLAQVEAAAPQTRPQIRRQRGAMVEALFQAGWTDAVVIVDYLPLAENIARHASGDLLDIDRYHLQRNEQTVIEADRRGYCTQRRSWFWVITDC
jgi:hypothetical protein